MRRRILIVVVLMLPALTAVAWATCGVTAICADVTTSFVGGMDGSDIVLTWSTGNENSTLQSYQLRRFNCQNPNSCSVFVATVTPSGTCGTTKNYTYTDTPPTPVNSWKYTLEVWKTDASRTCAVDTVPQ